MTATRKHALERLDVLAHELSGTGAGGRNGFLNRAAYELGGHVAAGVLDVGEVHAALEHAAQACGMAASEARYTIGRSLQEGARKPLDGAGDLPPIPKPSAYQKAQERAGTWAPLAQDEWTRLRASLAPLHAGEPATLDLARRGLASGRALTAYALTRDWGKLAHRGALAFEVRGPRGEVLAVKLRNVGSEAELKAAGLLRYTYAVKGHGTPAWCSPGYGQAEALLIVEGELNGAAAWTAAQAAGLSLDVQGLAGAGGTPHLAGIQGRPVYLYADDDKAGRECLAQLAQIAQEAGGAAVHVLPFLAAGLDCCDLLGAGELAGWLEASLPLANSWQSAFGGKNGLPPNAAAPSGQKSDWWQGGTTSQGWAASTDGWTGPRRGGW